MLVVQEILVNCGYVCIHVVLTLLGLLPSGFSNYCKCVYVCLLSSLFLFYLLLNEVANRGVHIGSERKREGLGTSNRHIQL
jgi:hypothetical protein